MLRKIRNWVWRASGTAQILNRLEQLEAIPRHEKSCVTLGGHEALEILPGTEYSRYAIPLDYTPSRDFAPRYGYSQSKIESIAEWFTAHNANYRSFVEELRSLKLDHIPVSVARARSGQPAWVGGAITAFDCLALYAMVRKYKPKTYLEIGSGMTTCFARQAAKDLGGLTRVISIDPQPRQEIDTICDEVVRNGLETCDLSLFDRLEEGDILFMDGSHRSFMNSDVTVFFIDVLPRLKPGVIVHIHDILLPWDYPESFKYWYWNEQYMLAVYLMNAMERLDPLLPTAWITRSSEFGDQFVAPFLDLGSAEANESWKHGGSMWFTKKA